MELLANQAYAEADGERIAFDMFRPEGKERLPLVVFLHGGGWMSGDRTMYQDEAVWLAPQGFACACISYRLAPEHPFPAAVADAQAFVRFARQNAGALRIDPDRIVAFGNSSGGHLACMLGLCDQSFGGGQEEDWRANAVVSLSGVTDVTDPRATQFPIVLGMLEAFLGGPYEGMEGVYRAASPLGYVKEPTCPFLLVHGDRDDIVPVDQSERLQAALQGVGADSTLHVLPGEEHAYTWPAWNHVRELYLSFFDRLGLRG